MKYGITRTEYQVELEKLPFFNKATAGILLQKDGINLDRKLERLTASGDILRLKRGLYTTKMYYLTSDKDDYLKKVAGGLYYPSYLSVEYVLAKRGLIPEAINVYTSITTKTTRGFSNFLGRFRYQNINQKLFLGFSDGMATTAKALFDFLYLKTNLSTNLNSELTEGLRINWSQFTSSDYLEFNQYIKLAQSPKMTKIAKVIGDILKI